MLLLAFETSAKAASVALFEDETLLAEQYQNTGLTHSQTLMVMAEDVLKQCGKTPRQVEAVAVANGPGSFTGVRIGVAAAKGFAWGGNLPLYGVSTLEAMARGLGISDGMVCAVMDARRKQVYNGIFAFQNGQYSRISPDRAISLEELGQELEKLSGPIYLVGDGSTLTWKTLSGQIRGLKMPAPFKMHQRAVGVGLAALAQEKNGIPPVSAAALVPNYLRLSQAERERNERMKLSNDR